MASSPPLVAQRERRANAGNRMRALLDLEFEAEEMFAEEEDDVEFVSQADEEDVFESDFASTEDEQEEEEAEEKAILREEKASRVSARKKAERTTTTSLFAPKPPGQRPQERPKPRPPKRVSIALPAETGIHGEARDVFPLRRRQSSRASAQTAKLRLERKLKEDAARKASMGAKPKRPKRPRKTQDQLIADALELEERNIQSLKDFLAREEEKKRAARVIRKTVHEGGVIAFISRAEEVRVPLVQPIEPIVAGVARGETTATVVSTDRAGTVETEGAKADTELLSGVLGSSNIAPPLSSDRPPALVGGRPAQEEAGPQRDESEAQHPQTQRLSAEANAESIDRPMDEMMRAGGMQDSQDQDNERKEAALHPILQRETKETPTFAGEEQTSAAAQLRAAVRISSEEARGHATSAEQHFERFLQTRNWVALKDLLPADDFSDDEGESDVPKSKNKAPWTWVEEMTALFGDHVDWGSLRVVPIRNRPIYRRPPICPMTGLPALYRDPETGIPYANAKAYRTLRRLMRHEFVWSDGRGIYYADETELGARGVPDTWNGYVRGTMPRQQEKSTSVAEDVEMDDAPGTSS